MKWRIFLHEITRSFSRVLDMVCFMVLQEGGAVFIGIEAGILAGGPLLNPIQLKIGLGRPWSESRVVGPHTVMVMFQWQNVII